jgi:EmrB/QacA subfamily drug resistance transporter
MRKWLPLLAVCLGNFMLLLDVTIVNVALPDVAADLGTSFGALQWVVDGYTLALAALVLAVGSVADVFGHRRTYLVGLVVFAASSLVSALAPTAGTLVAARAVQGLGGAAMLATSFALLNASYEGRDRGVAYGVWGAVSGGAAAIGPLVGGLLTDAGSWRWVFLVNLPVSVGAIALTALAVRPGRGRGRLADLDVPGVVLFSAAAAALTAGLIAADEHGWSARGAWLPLAVTPVLLFAFVRVEVRSPRPLLDLSLLRRAPFVAVMAGAMLLTFAAFGTYPYISLWLQSVAGLSAVQAGSATVPLSATAFVVALGAGRHLHRVRPGTVIGVGLLLVGAGALVNAALVHGDAGWASMLPGFVVTGIGSGLATPTLGAAAAGSVPIERAGMAAGVLNTMRQLGLTFGIAVLGGVFASRVTGVLAGHGVADPAGVAREVSGGQTHQVLGTWPGPTRSALEAGIRAAAVDGVQATFLVCGLAGLAAGVLVLVLHRPRPAASVVLADAVEETSAA